jgi:hypothetical protein
VSCPHLLLQVGPGDQAQFLFRPEPGETRYHVYLGRRLPEPAREVYEPKAGLVVEVRDLPEGRFAHAPEIVALFESSRTVQGRRLVSQVFHGANPVGGTPRFVARYRGHLHVAAKGAYRIVTASSDASTVLVDGKVVAQWGGIHPANAGVRGQFGSTVDLEPGLHRLEYYWVKATDAAPAAAVLGIQRPTDLGPVLAPPAAFLQPTTASVLPLETRDARRVADFTWRTLDHLEQGGLHAVRVQFDRVPPPDGEEGPCRWTFDDGSAADGPTVVKVFFGAGERAVALARDDPAGRAEGRLTVDARPAAESVRPPQGEALEAYRAGFDAPDPRVADARTLEAQIALADDLDRTARVLDLWDRLRGRSEARSLPGFARVCEILGGRFLRAPFCSPAKAEEALRLGTVAAQDEGTRLRCLRQLAEILVNAKGDPDGAEELLEGLDALRADKAEDRRLLILEGDIEAQRGNGDGARACYGKAGATAPPWDKQVAVRREALLFSAEAWLRRGEHAGVVEALEDWLLAQPLDRIEPHVLWLAGRAWAGLGQHPRARVWFERGLGLDPHGPVAPRLLLDLADLLRRAGDEEGAAAREELLRTRFPYSDEAARLHARRQGIRLEGDDGPPPAAGGGKGG